MSERPDFDTLATAICLAAGRVADQDGRMPVHVIREPLARDLAACWPGERYPSDEDNDAALNGSSVPPSVQVDTPAQHITWASTLLAQMSRQRFDSGQTFAVEEAIVHLRRAAELI